MCTYIIERAVIAGSAKGPSSGRRDWTKVTLANVYYDHPQHAPFDHALNLDFVDASDPRNDRVVALELSAESARELVSRILAALAAGEAEHAAAPAGRST